MSDAEIEAGIAADPDAAPELDAEWFKHARVVMPEPKQPVYFRLDQDVLRWFKQQGPRYQTRMNAVLRAYMTAHGEEGGS